jgi:hypothetical protein
MVRGEVVVQHAYARTVDHIEIYAPDEETLDQAKKRVTSIITEEMRVCSGINALLRILEPHNTSLVEAHIPSRISSYKFRLTGNIYDILCRLMDPFEIRTDFDHKRINAPGWQKTASTACCARFSSKEPFALDVVIRVNPDDPDSVYAAVGSFQNLRIPADRDSIRAFLEIAHDVYCLNIEMDKTAAVFCTSDGVIFIARLGEEVNVLRSIVLGRR